MEFKDRLKSLRLKNGLSQAILADMLDVSSSLIGLYETGKRKPSAEKIESLASVFGVSIDYLMGKEEDTEYYTDPKTVEIANELKDNPGLRLLFDAGKDLPPEDILKTLDFIKHHL
jgi:transcriptional regulator with XRE-family HTH domain